MSEIRKIVPGDISKVKVKDKTESGEVTEANRKRTESYIDFQTVNIYKFLMECQKGMGGFSGNTTGSHKTYIVPNSTEPDFPTRVKRAVFINYFNKFLKALYKDIYSLINVKTTVLNSAGKSQEGHRYDDYVNDITGGGVSKDSLNKSIINASYRDAVSFIIGDIEDGETQPFCYFKNAIDVANDDNGIPLYDTDKKGNLINITFCEPDEMDIDNKRIEARRFWGLEEFRLEKRQTGKKWVVVENFANTLTFNGKRFLPVKPIISQERDNNHDYLPMPNSYAIAKIVLGIYDRGSVLDHVVDKQGHSIAVINGDITSMPSGKYNALVYAEGDNKLNAPFYMSPDYHLPAVHSDRIAGLIIEMLDMMDESGVSASLKQVSPESGIAKAISLIPKIARTKETIRLIEQCDKFEETIYKVYLNEENADWYGETTYPTEFMPTSDLTFTDLADMILVFDKENLTANKADVIKKLIEKLNPNASKDDIEQLISEVDVVVKVAD